MFFGFVLRTTESSRADAPARMVAREFFSLPKLPF